MRRQVMLLGILFSFYWSVQAQQVLPNIEPTNTLSLSIGYNQGYIRDANYAPLNFTEGGLIYGLGYTRTLKNGDAFLVNLDYSSGKLTTDVSDLFDSEYIAGNLKLGYLKKLNNLQNEKIELAIGGGYHFNIMYFEWGDQQAFSFLATHSFDLSTKLKYTLDEKQHISAKLDLPLISLIVRPPYNGFDEELTVNNEEHPVKLITNGYWGFFNKLIAPELQLTYHNQLSNRVGLDISYLGRYQQVFDINAMVQLQNQLSAALTFQL